jgi:hypothetical protein
MPHGAVLELAEAGEGLVDDQVAQGQRGGQADALAAIGQRPEGPRPADGKRGRADQGQSEPANQGGQPAHEARVNERIRGCKGLITTRLTPGSGRIKDYGHLFWSPNPPSLGGSITK